MAIAELNGHFSEGIVVEPELLQVCQIAYLRRQFHYIVETQIESDQIVHAEYLRQAVIKIHLGEMKGVRSLSLGHPSLDLVVLPVGLVRCQKLVR